MQQQRLEVVTSVERRRRWTRSEKEEILAECDSPGASVSGVARRHGISRSLIQNWKKAMRFEGRSDVPTVDCISTKEPPQLPASSPRRGQESDFVTLVTGSKASPLSEGVIRVLQPDGFMVEFPVGTSPARLAAFVYALRG